MKIFIRADGGEKIGIGHIMRTMVLAKELRKDFDVTYICLKCSEYNQGYEILKNNGFKIMFINSKEELLLVKNTIIIFDKYGLEEEYFEKVRKNENKIVLFDDNCNLKYYIADIIINQNFYGEELQYNCSENTKLLLGSKYTLLREEFRNSEKSIELKKEIKDIMVTVGGSDNNNITEKILNQLVNKNYNIHIIIGPAFKYQDRLYKYKNDRINFYKNAIVSEIMKKCDVIISGCGSTVYESLAMGIPTIPIVLVDNQKKISEYVKRHKLGKVAEVKDISNIIDEMNYSERVSYSLKGKLILDGNGVFRIVNEVKKLAKSS
ncbi:UDP-2,4-diacetamido-2,4,6-trideoxy-beta-L-altropyranose hydrolase [uncultured Clostridium sp.]|uniref:UDP-2,4-diacetamido-2,4, 6-trideoxy-beta-L-altropyranose hydrolase n=1 Tax=uncultured Clostridium sp. TaxID=59620 RepID=UPI0025D93B1E|nr:UDP-2,4-diacetamido-2,4,6-trideoxy-beta-L-altropyranose hydrolase [uncultured Clostridium sp.]